ncbi:MAG: RlmE family RNA methyltransferase [Alphaproteobacteria bacterium]|nr:RlmE family RNA methyltransferase [Alphaproteobacteria bacterium]MDP6604025.1 RlmE family RNA methyltransferase [Rhodospirillales bacterium]
MARRKPGGRKPSRAARVRVKTAKGRGTSSTRWLQRQLNDPYVRDARRLGYRSRASFKLIELDEKHRLLKPGMRVVDLGAAPGGWSQVSAEAVGRRGRVVAVDLQAIDPIAGVEVIVADVEDPDMEERLRAALGGPADLVLSDMVAPATGHAATDHLRSVVLAERAFEIACAVLVPGGAFVVKILQGRDEAGFVKALRRRFDKAAHAKPPASRRASVELYIVANGFRA